MADEPPLVAVLDLAVADGEMLEPDGLEALEIVAEAALDAAIERRPRHMRGTPGDVDERAVADDQAPVLEDKIGPREHRFLVGLLGVDRDVGRGAGAEMAAVFEAQDARRRGAREDGDFVEAVFAIDAGKRTGARG